LSVSTLDRHHLPDSRPKAALRARAFRCDVPARGTAARSFALFVLSLLWTAVCWAQTATRPFDPDFAESARSRLAAAEARGDVREVAAAQLDLAKYMLTRSLSGQALEFARLARAGYPQVDADPLSLEIDIALAAGLQSSGRTAEALEILLETTARAERLGLVELEQRSRLNLSSTYGRSGRLDEAQREIERGLALAEQRGDAASQARFLINAGRVSIARGDGQAGAWIARAESIVIDPPDAEVERMVLLAGVTGAMNAGDRAQALSRAERAFATATAQSNDYYRAFALEYIARLRCELPPDAGPDPLAQFAEAAAAFEQLDQPHDGARLHRLWASCLERSGRHQEALALERQAGVLQIRAHERLQVEAMEASEAAFRTRERALALARLEADNSKLAEAQELQSARVAWLVATLALVGIVVIWQAARFRLLQSRRDREQAVAQRQVEMLAFTGHEIRNPAQCLLGILESGSLRPASEEPRALDLALSAARMVARLASDSLQLAKLEQGLYRASDLAPVCLRKLASETAMLATQARSVSEQKIAIEFADDVAEWVSSDAARLSQILLNLLGNALAYSDNSPVRLRCSRQPSGEGVLIEIIDQGPGLSKEDIDNAGASFRRGESAARNPQGSGLGLAISMRLATTLGGALRLRNGETGGAVAELSLPCRACAGPAPEASPIDASARAADSALRVLVVDDDALPRHGLAILLASLGCEVDEAEDGAGLARALESGRYDLLVLDLHLGDEHGTDLAERLLGASTNAPHRPNLAIVSGDAEDARLRSAHPIIDAWISKPVSRQDVLGLLDLVRRSAAAKP
jgi:signal transduction histidine kinase